jgi:uncharacterized membrane-anchored protein YitT (DUF2179 family)
MDYPIINSDKLLVPVFGSFLDTGIGLSTRGRGGLDGTEVLALPEYENRIKHLVLIFNIFIFSAAAYFSSHEIAL